MALRSLALAVTAVVSAAGLTTCGPGPHATCASAERLIARWESLQTLPAALASRPADVEARQPLFEATAREVFTPDEAERRSAELQEAMAYAAADPHEIALKDISFVALHDVRCSGSSVTFVSRETLDGYEGVVAVQVNRWTLTTTGGRIAGADEESISDTG